MQLLNLLTLVWDTIRISDTPQDQLKIYWDLTRSTDPWFWSIILIIAMQCIDIDIFQQNYNPAFGYMLFLVNQPHARICERWRSLRRWYLKYHIDCLLVMTKTIRQRIFFKGEYFSDANIFEGWIFSGVNIFRTNIFQGWIFFRSEFFAGVNIFQEWIFFRGEYFFGMSIFRSEFMSFAQITWSSLGCK